MNKVNVNNFVPIVFNVVILAFPHPLRLHASTFPVIIPHPLYLHASTFPVTALALTNQSVPPYLLLSNSSKVTH